MIKLLRWCAAVMLSLCVLVVVGGPARADSNDSPSSWEISRYQVTATPDDQGTTRIVVDLDFNFASDPGHGPYIVLVTRMPDNSNPDQWRMIDVNVESVTSSTGANTAIKETSESDALLLRIGTEGRTFTGVQNYRITYTATGLIDPKNPTSGLDEFNWTAIGGGWQVPINNISVTVKGPVATQRTACFAGSGMTTECSQLGGVQPSSSGSDSATWTLPELAPGDGMQVVAGYPGGTFSDVQIRYTKRIRPQNMFPMDPVTIGVGGAAALAGLGGVTLLARRHGRDRAYLGLVPGLTPTGGAGVSEGMATKTPVAVQFRPPKDARPGEIGVLIDETADNRDVTATIIDLAVRGHLVVRNDRNGNLLLTKTGHPDQLAPYEATLLTNLFQGSSTVTEKMMAQQGRAAVLTATRRMLYDRVTKDRPWFRANPQHTRSAWYALGIVGALTSLGLAGLLGLNGWGWVGLGLLVPAIGLLFVARLMPARTAEGSAMLAQAKGFELYLRTAEADQIKFEEGIDVFSRYLPYAIVFGVADRWAKIFQDLAARGVYQGDTSWFGGGPGIWMIPGLNLGGMMDQMTSSMSSSMSQAVAASHTSSAGGGGSGFSSGGGGGFGGGGGGGW